MGNRRKGLRRPSFESTITPDQMDEGTDTQVLRIGGRVISPTNQTPARPHPASVFRPGANTTFMDLPVEMRMQIYGYILEEDQPIKLRIIKRNGRTEGPREIARAESNRDVHHRGQVWDAKQRSWVDAPPSHTAIMFVNKQVYAEATQVLYGSNTFHFKTTTVLREFLEVLGKRAQHLRYIQLGYEGYIKASIGSALKLLLQARGLRKLQLDDGNFSEFSRQYFYDTGRVNARKLASDFKPLLTSLRTSYEAERISANVLDVVTVARGSVCRLCEALNRFAQESGYVDWLLNQGDECTCEREAKVTADFNAKLRALIAARLGIDEEAKTRDT